MGSAQSYRRTHECSWSAIDQTLTNTIARTVSCRNLRAVFQDDQNLTGTDEAEFPPGDSFERGGISLKATGCVAQGRVFGLEMVEAFSSDATFLPGPNTLGQTTVAE